MSERKPGHSPNIGRNVAVGMAAAIGLVVLGSFLFGQPGANVPMPAKHPAQSDLHSKEEPEQNAAKVPQPPDIRKAVPRE